MEGVHSSSKTPSVRVHVAVGELPGQAFLYRIDLIARGVYSYTRPEAPQDVEATGPPTGVACVTKIERHPELRPKSMLAKDERTLAEALGSRGYRTGGFSANWLIRQRLGFGQGFDLFEAMRGTGEALQQKSERGENTVARAFRWIDRLALYVSKVP